MDYRYSQLPEVVVGPSLSFRGADRPPPLPPKPAHLLQPQATPTPCCECQRIIKTWKCVQCDDFFCDGCWLQQRPHKPGKVGSDGRPHEKVDEEVIHRLRKIFSQPTKEEQERRHGGDVNTTWFGVVKEANQPFLHYSNRLVDILHENQIQVPIYPERFPQLVSFVGQTGDGKSTLIKMLINREQSRRRDNDVYYSAPVPGLVGDNIPTTGDVHLYSDPGSYFNQNPILYADCEGMTGGENTPRGLTTREKTEGSKKPAVLVKNQVRKRIIWANNPKMQSREYAVTSLFPKILYTFSDVVVFVLKEVRRFETEVLQQLVNWAAMSIDKSINQPSLPHLVIVLNACDPNIDERLWDPEHATHNLLDDYKWSFHQVPALREVTANLRAVGKDVRTTKQLLEYYYSSVTVLRIPTKGRYMQIDQQVSRLQSIMNEKCTESHAHKKFTRMLLNAERLPQYVNVAYDHFSQRLDEPFDFAEVARRHTPMPRDFGGHILNLILTMYKRSGQLNPKVLFKKLCRPIASCVILAANRDNTQGTYSSLLRNTYQGPIKSAFADFCDRWLQCCYHDGEYRCQNVKSLHKKGHQGHTGKILARGAYQSTFDDAEFFDEWIEDINRNIVELNRRLQNSAVDKEERSRVTSLHRSVLADFYNNMGRPFEFKSNTTCLCCVRRIPEFVLRCGHVLCKACIQSFGRDMGQGLFELDSCPLHVEDSRHRNLPDRIRLKPHEAGVRVLSLDGGGVRGIVELVLLRALEAELGGRIPIQNFFDLIVGTSTGGIIALGLGVKRWSVTECTSRFKELCKPAFTERPFKSAALISHKSYYKSTPLEEAFQSAFDNHSPLFGSSRPESSTTIRVAVTSTEASDNRPVILSNYNTEGDERDHQLYKLVRPQDPAAEFKIWEAARATSAAPLYFKPYIQPKTREAYTDGGIHHNCPASIAESERALIWEDVAHMPPDILLSLGTGFSTASHKSQLALPQRQPLPNPREISHNRSVSGLRYMMRVAHDILDDRTNCEDIWSRFYSRVSTRSRMGRTEDRRRNMRINVRLPDPWPKLDNVAALGSIEDHVLEAVTENDDIRADIREAAHRLVASCFYFERSGSARQSHRTGQYTCDGNIRCRFGEGSADVKGLGNVLSDYINGKFVPFFFLQENYGSPEQKDHEVPIPIETINQMCNTGHFELLTGLQIDSATPSHKTRLCICLQPTYYPSEDHHMEKIPGLLSISGFPRELFSTQDTILSPIPLSPVPTDEDKGVTQTELPVTPRITHFDTEPVLKRLYRKSSMRFMGRPKSTGSTPPLPENWSGLPIPSRPRDDLETDDLETSSLVELPLRSSRTSGSGSINESDGRDGRY